MLGDHYYVREILIPQVKLFATVARDHIFPAFEDLETRAKAIETEAWEELERQFAGWDDSIDPADVAESAFDESLRWYCSMNDMRDALYNVCTVWLFHLFENQFALFIRDRTSTQLERGESVMSESLHERLLKDRLFGVDARKLEEWSDLQQLRLTANAIKHGDGPSAEILREIRPDFFRPADEAEPYSLASLTPISALTGEGLYVKREDFEGFVDKVLAFWESLAAQMGG